MSRHSCISHTVVWAFVLAVAPVVPASAQTLPVETAFDGPPAPVPPAVVSRSTSGGVTVRAVRLTNPIAVDGRLDEEVYAEIPSIGDFVQQEPSEGTPATERTEVWLLFDTENLYIVARCWDSQPDRIIATEMRRDHMNIYQNDNFTIVLDTFYDRRSGFFFQTNPAGAVREQAITDEGGDVNNDWNTVWTTAAARFEQGWTTEMAIPFRSLRYQGGGPQIWGINMRRVVRWKNELSFLGFVPASYGPPGIYKLSSAATMVGLDIPSTGNNLEAKPYAITSLTTDRVSAAPFSNDLGGDVGLDVKYGVTQNLTADFTVNTDFSQVEDDDQQVNLTRFSLFFPEKREFFLEGQGIFSFGGAGGTSRRGGNRGGGQGSTPILFFSRRIGLSGGQAVPIQGGARLTGKMGAYSVGVINIQTGEVDEAGAAATNFSVVRVKRDLLRRSTIGVVATSRDPTSRAAETNLAFGLDGSFSFFENVFVDGYYAQTNTGDDNSSYRAAFDYAADRYGLSMEHLLVGEAFDPQVGFVRRDNFRRSFVQARFSPRPAAPSAIRRFTWEGSLDYTTDPGGERLQTRELAGLFGIEFQSSDFWRVEYTRTLEALDEVFDIADDVPVPAGSYTFQHIQTSYRLGAQRSISGTVTAGRGTFYGGNRTELGYNGRVEVSPRLAFEPRISWNLVDLPSGSFVTRLVSTRSTFTLSPRSAVSALVQYNSSGDSLSSNIRFRWEYIPGSDLFVVYSDVRDTLASGFPNLENRSFAVKLTRLMRF